VKVEFHFGTGGLDEKNYYISEFYPTYRDIEEIIDIEIVPFGLSRVFEDENGNYTFWCPNGQNECLGNKIHVSLA
jgi:hypothetical protein